jgi:hypothetical protein
MALAKRLIPVVILVFFILVVVWPRSLSTPRTFLNQRRAILSMENVSLAERKYAARHPEIGYACSLSDLGEQGSEVGLVDRVLASGTKAGFHFEIQCPQHESQKVARYAIVATPVNPGTTGKYALCTDQSGQIWYSENGSAADCLETRKPLSRSIGDITGSLISRFRVPNEHKCLRVPRNDLS